MEQLECTLRRARITVAETQIGIDDANKIELRKMMAFRHQLRADHDIEAALRNVIELAPEAFDRFHEIAREYENARIRKKLGRFLFEPLNTRADRDKAIGRLTLRTLQWRRH